MDFDFTDPKEAFVKKMMNTIWAAPPMCEKCGHKAVCKYAEEKRAKCVDYKHEPDYKRHGDIHELFQPIFDWIQHHYPAGNVSFRVDKNSAQMQLDYGVSALSRKIMDMRAMNCCTVDGIEEFRKEEK